MDISYDTTQKIYRDQKIYAYLYYILYMQEHITNGRMYSNVIGLRWSSEDFIDYKSC